MGSEAEVDEQHSKIPKLPLFSIPPMKSPQRSGMLTPPLHASASVPFHWEQEPGKPRPSTALITFCNNIPKCLELPPRLLLPSPTTVLEGPYVEGSSSNRFQSPPSFRMINEEEVLGSMVLTKGGGRIKQKGWWFGSWRKRTFKVKSDVNGDSHVFSTSVDKESLSIGARGTKKKVNMPKKKRYGSFSSLSHGKSHLWVRLVRFKSMFNNHVLPPFHCMYLTTSLSEEDPLTLKELATAPTRLEKSIHPY